MNVVTIQIDLNDGIEHSHSVRLPDYPFNVDISKAVDELTKWADKQRNRQSGPQGNEEVAGGMYESQRMKS